MAGYIFKRLLRSILSLIVIVFVIMILVFQLMDRNVVLGKNADLQHHSQTNDKLQYSYEMWELYGYVDMVKFSEYAQEVADADENLSYSDVATLPDNQNDDVNYEYVEAFKKLYKSKGYTIYRRDRNTTSDGPILFASKDVNVFQRLWKFFSNLIYIDHTSYVKLSDEYIEANGDIDRYIKICKDPLNGGLCVMGSGTKNRYLLYFDSTFPFIHQNFITLNLGTRFANNEDFFSYFISYQGNSVAKTTTLASGVTVTNANNYHERTFAENASDEDIALIGDNYTIVTSMHVDGMSMIGYSFVIGIIATILEYVIGIPLGMLLALKKDSIWDKLGNFYIIFIMAVPSLAYIYIFASIGGNWFGLPTVWVNKGGAAQIPYFILPILSLTLPAVASLMKWIRRYTIDQMTSDYVKFARSQGFSEREIFSKHILKNALIPIVQGIPASILACLTGAIITERVYGVPGMGKLLTSAINSYDNGVIVGISFFYALLSIISLILGDILMAKMDPRISFGGGGGRK